MDKKFIVGVVAVVAVFVAGYFFTRVEEKQVSGNIAVYKNSELGYEFSYKTGPDGYVVEEAIPANPSQGLLSSIMLVQTKDVPAIQNPPQGGEGPATINISVYKNTKNEQDLNWANNHVQWSNINLKQGEVSETVVGGANAIRYKADGLYASDVVVVTHGGYVYVLTGMYIDYNSNLRKDFSPLVESLKFIPAENTNVGAKINIDAVCEGALVYMTFPDGKSADAFVKDCKEGKHPEVIEKYKADMNLGAGANI